MQGIFTLTYWGQDKMSASLQMTLSIAFSWMRMLEFRLKSYWSLFLRVQLTSIGSDNGLASTRHRAIIWTKDDLDYWCIYVSLSLNESIVANNIFRTLIKRAQGRRKFGMKNFRRRYFQLTNYGLSYYKAKGNAKSLFFPHWPFWYQSLWKFFLNWIL